MPFPTTASVLAVNGADELRTADPWDSQYKTFTPLFHNILGCCVIVLFLYNILPLLLKKPRSPGNKSQERGQHISATTSGSINAEIDAEHRPLLGSARQSNRESAHVSRTVSQIGVGMDVSEVQILLQEELYKKQLVTYWILVITSIAAAGLTCFALYDRRAIFSGSDAKTHWHSIALGLMEPLFWTCNLLVIVTDRKNFLPTRTVLQTFWILHFVASAVRFYDLEEVPRGVAGGVVERAAVVRATFAVTAVAAVVAVVDIVRERRCELYEINAEAKLLNECRNLVKHWVDSGAYTPADGGSKQTAWSNMASADRQRASEQFVKNNMSGTLCMKLLFWMVVRVDAPLMMMGLMGAVLGSLGSVILPLAVGQATDAAAHAMYDKSHAVVEEIDSAGRAFILPLVLIGVGQFLNGAFVEVSGTRVVCRVQRLVFVSICRQDVAYFDEHKVGEITSLLQTNVAMLRAGMTTALASSIKGLLQFILGLVFMIHGVHGGKGSPKLFGIVLGLGMPAVVSICVLMKAGTHFAKVMTERAQKSSGVATEMISAIKTLFTFNLEHYAEKKYSKAVRHTMAAGITKDVLQGSMTGITYASWMCATTLTWYFGGHMIYTGEIDMQYLATFISLISQVLGGFMQVFGLLPALGAAVGAAQTLFKPILLCPSISDAYFRGLIPPSARGTVELHGVRFLYPTRPDVEVLQGLSLTIPAGASVGIVGASGSGKSTILQLVERFYDATDGTVTLDGVNVKDIDIEWLRDRIGVVMQEPKLLSGTIRENIALGKRAATFDDITAAAKLANAHDFILQQPQGYDTKIGEGGATLSGGQKQRIAIARAVVKDPRILLLDEATSALDSTSEVEVQKALEKVSQGRTTLTVAHRRSAIEKADVIHVMDGGRIVESGTFDELLQTGTVFQGLYGSSDGH
eukprot:m.326834 g.326834  ORF g.326834 m.326834 type:complete len:918 (-) comp20409_c0_seq11:3336-6089(-)